MLGITVSAINLHCFKYSGGWLTCGKNQITKDENPGLREQDTGQALINTDKCI